jgi:hypothetical protein
MRKIKFYQKSYLGLFFFLPFIHSCATSKPNKTAVDQWEWQAVSKSELNVPADSLPKNYVLYKVDFEVLRQKFGASSLQQSVFVKLPSPDSGFVNYSVREVEVMAPALAKKFPFLKSYAGTEESKGANKARLNFDEFTFTAHFSTLDGEFFINPIKNRNQLFYLVFKKADAPFQKQPFEITK